MSDFGGPVTAQTPERQTPESSFQLKLSETELNRLVRRIEDDYTNDVSDHSRRMERFRLYYQKFRNRVDPPEAGDEDVSNFSVPLVQWNVYQRWAEEVSSLLGEDAEIVAKPTGPSDQKRVKKVGLYMTWRLFQSMRLTNPLVIFLFRKILFGRTHAYQPWTRDTYRVKEDDGSVHDEIWFEGPGFDPLWPDDLIVPAEDVKTIHDFSHVMRRYRVTPEDLLRGERDGLYQGIKADFQNIVQFSDRLRQREWQGEEIKREKDEAEGVLYEGGLSARGALIVHEWYGKWRMLKGKQDGREDNLDRRNEYETELVVRFLPEMHKIVGVQDLMDLYPKKRNRRPFVESSLTKDGSYWSAGLGELLYSIEDEASANHNLFTDAGELAVGPLIFVKPGAGVNPEKFKYEPKTIVETEDPQGVNVVRMEANLTYPLQKEQIIVGYAERVSGNTDLNMGRSEDRPNAPRTATGTVAILNAGSVRASLDTTVLREDMGLIALNVWELDTELAPPSVFFRVTEEDADGLFDVKGGGSEMTAQERGGRYDFDIKFATSVYSREAKKQTDLALYQLDLQNPLIAQNPKALWNATNKVHAALGDDNFADIIPEPPDLDAPRPPREEWTMALEGEDFHVNPMDNDDLHLIDHYRRLTDSKTDPDRDEDAVNRMVQHVMEHQTQKRQKMLMQALTAHIAQSLSAGTGGLVNNAPPTSLQDLHGTIGSLIGAPGAQPPGAPGQPGTKL